MCGISFLYNSSYTSSELKESCKASIQLMSRRGPDSSGVDVLGHAGFGHARLSIVGLTDSRQPMISPEGRYVLTYNGEIYNYRELRTELSQKWRFRTTGDTEVLLAGLIVEGESFLGRLEGMWAFAFWDSKLQKLFLSRDRMGKKPLYYFHDIESFGAASELPALNKLAGRKWQEDLDTTADYFRYGYPLPGETFFRDVRELPGGCSLTWGPGSDPVIERYWSPRVTKYQGDYQTAVEDLQFRLTEAVGRRLVADVKVGTFLSGGVDSSVVTAIGSRLTGSQLESFTIGFSDSAYDESAFAKRTANYLGIKNHRALVDNLSFEAFEEVLLERIGQPFHDSSLVPTSAVCELASSQVKVALSGDGADELFGGYQRYRARKILNIYLGLPVSARKAMRSLVKKLPEPDSHHSRSILKKLHLFMNVVDRREAEQPYIAPCFFSQEHYAEIFPELIDMGKQFDRPWSSSESLSDIKEMMLSDSFVYLPQDILTKVDRASMHSSIEARAPFLDSSVVELALSLPIEWTHGWSYSKKIIASAFSEYLPSEVWKRNKQGFAVPISRWFREELGVRLEHLLETSLSPVINVKAVKQLLNAHRAGTADFGYRLWLVYVYLLWRVKCDFLERD
jgi:asparagine synthase (glutamine-hydrolysing)